MTRVHHVRPQHATPRSTILDQPRAVAKKKKPYKIVLEAVTQEKKKLHSILTYASNAPKGFGFIPAGHPEFTEWCKEQCRQRNLDVHIVSAKPKNKTHADPEKLSHHVHRVGHHFPLEIVNLACSKFGYTYDEAQGLQKDKSRDRTNWIARGIEDYSSRQQLHGRPSTEKESKEHTRGAVREMFPKIPEADLDSIVNHAFEEGTNRVGNAKELSLARRVQLAVVAHIRHVYTDYDKMLKTGSWMQARQSVEHVSLAKLKEWRDEAGEASNEIEDTFREVIILDDDDDDDESSEEGSLLASDEREQSMEIVSSRATARDLQPEIYTNYPRMDIHAMRRAPRRTIVVQPHPSLHSASLSAPSHRLPVSQPHPRLVRHNVQTLDARPRSRDPSFRTAHGHPIEARSRPQDPHLAPRGPPLMQEIDGQLYHVSVELVEPIERAIKLEPIKESLPPTRHHPLPRATPRYAQNEYVQIPPAADVLSRPPVHSRRASEQDVVLPSVERESIDLTSPRRNTNSQHSYPDSRPVSGSYATLQSPKRRSFPSSSDDRDSHFGSGYKRPRPAYHEQDLAPRAGPAHLSRPPQENSHHPTDLRSRPRAQPSQEYIDLTSSPRRPVTNGENRYHVPPHAPAGSGSSDISHVPVPSYRAPVREERVQYQVHSGEPPRAYMSSSGVYEGRAPPVRDYIPYRDEQHQRPVEGNGAGYIRSGLHYGNPNLH